MNQYTTFQVLDADGSWRTYRIDTTSGRTWKLDAESNKWVLVAEPELAN